MIIVKLIGGLGNQLFQYATARHLSVIQNTELLLDISEFDTYHLHKFSLFAFNITEKFATLDQINNLPVYKEKHFHFDPEFKKIPNNIVLKGYWQTEKYFMDIENIILKNFSFKNPAKDKDKKILQSISSTNSVSLHIRRGDYVKNTYESQLLISKDINFYHKCVRYIIEKENNCHFFVFSDDPSWVKENLKLQYPVTYVDHNNADTNFEDLRLMSSCKHNILSNSSFSWWGAWLNRNPNKIVCAPQKWFSDETKYLDSKDILPEKWIKL